MTAPSFVWQHAVPVSNTLLVSATAQRMLAIYQPMRALRDAAVRTFLADPHTEILGAGSNVLILSEQLPQVAQIRATGWQALVAGAHVWIVAEAGLGLDELVRATAARGWFGLERLAEIPGTVGAAPIQNVGAYGVQLSDFVTGLTVWDRTLHCLTHWTAAECEFSYRDSRFKQEPARWLVLSVALRLSTRPPADWPPLDYPGIQGAAEQYAVAQARPLTALTPLDLAAIITGVRQKKLPDWRRPPPGSAGSFFQNPIVPLAQATALRNRFPQLPQYATPMPTEMKLSAGWLIEHSGWRGRRIGDAGVYSEHALVLVNHGQASGAALRALAEQIQRDVWQRFGVQLVAEPRYLGC